RQRALHACQFGRAERRMFGHHEVGASALDLGEQLVDATERPGNRYGIVPRRQPARDVVGDLLRRGEQGELEGHRMSPEGLREASSLLSDRAAADAEDVERARRLLEALLVEVDR